MANKTKRLHELQDILIEEFILRIQTGEASPSDLNAARQLLKDRNPMNNSRKNLRITSKKKNRSRNN